MSRDTVLRVSYVSLLALFNSLLNFFFQIVVANAFGAGVETDAFFLASSVPEWVMNIMLFVLPMTVIPRFSALLAAQSEERAWRFGFSLLALLTSILALITAAVILSRGFLTTSIAGNLSTDGRELFSGLLALVSPIMVFGTGSSILIGMYYSHGRLVVPSLAPLAQTVVMITAVVTLQGLLGIHAAAVGLLAGAATQFAVLALCLRPQGAHLFRLERNEDLGAVLALMVPLLAGSLILKSQVFVDRYIGSFLTVGAISYLYYSGRMVRVIARFASKGVTTVYFPRLAKTNAAGDTAGYVAAFDRAMGGVVVVALLCAGAVWVTGEELVTLLFQRGNFTAEAARQTALALIVYTGTLAAFPVGDVVNNAYYSVEDTRTPVIVNLIFFAISVPLKILAALWWGLIGLVAAASLVNVANQIGLLLYLPRRVPAIRLRRHGLAVLSAVGAAVVAAGGALGLEWVVTGGIGSVAGSKAALFGEIVLTGSVFTLLFAVLGWVFGNPTLTELGAKLFARFRTSS